MNEERVLPFSSAKYDLTVAGKPATTVQWSLLDGSSPAAARLRAQIRRVAPYFRTALLTGEDHCGEEEVARTLHELSPVCELPFRVVTAESAEQILSAATLTDGLLYLPDVGKLSRTAQMELLHWLRAGYASRGTLRVVAYAGQGLRALTSAGTFSAELASSFEALRLALPPLRERAPDIPMLMSHISREVAEALGAPAPQLTKDFLQAAERFDWPGNLAQMQSVMRWLQERNSGGLLQAGDMAAALSALGQTTSATGAGPRMVRLELVLQEHIRSVLIACNGNKLRAAEVLGISRSTLYRMLETTGYDADWQMAG
jgi:DNA-binding NtrC family response regulator